MSALPRVAVVIPCRNEAATITSLLNAVARQEQPPHEMIVVDDGSIDGTAQVVAEWRRANDRLELRVVPGEGRGVAAAMNAGIRAGEGEIIVRLDGHCRPRPDYIRRAAATLRERDAGVVGGIWEIEPGAATHIARAVAAVVAHPAGSGGAAYRDAERARGAIEPVDTVPFGCFRRSLWEEVGGFDEALLSNEDYDFNHRVRLAGHSVLLNTDVRSAYLARPTLRALAQQYFRYGFWKMQMLKKSPGSLRLRQVLPALVIPWLVSSTVLAIAAPSLPALIVVALYPALIAAASLQIVAGRGDASLLLPAVAALAVLHASWSAGFWRGLFRPPSRA